MDTDRVELIQELQTEITEIKNVVQDLLKRLENEIKSNTNQKKKLQQGIYKLYRSYRR